MTDKLITGVARGPDAADVIRSWVMVLLTLIFVTLYGAGLVGWLRPWADEKLVMRFEPIVFVIIGYYFGRIPSKQNEKTLKDEIDRQTQKANATQHAKEQVQQAREGLEEKVKNVRAALTSATHRQNKVLAVEGVGRSGSEDTLRSSVNTALSILES